ncbi:MAG TPA: hypothetical protein VFQ16_00850 [Burkholderiaceae bacterium]|nr:hypothetical protein [Burkholderiaceae bacterium]
MKSVLAACVLAAMVVHAQATRPVVEVRPEPAREAWWWRTTLHPQSTRVMGVAVRRLHPEWCAAEAFSAELFGEALLGPAGGDPLAGLAFSIEDSFDGSGKAQVAFVGAYRRCAGEQGLFVAIVEPHKDRPRTRFLVEVPDAPSAFGALGREPDGTLAVWWCAGCSEGYRIAYNRQTREFYIAGPATRRQ